MQCPPPPISRRTIAGGRFCVRTRRELAHDVLEQAFQMLTDNVRGLWINEALFVPPGGYRSALGTLEHLAGWSGHDNVEAVRRRGSADGRSRPQLRSRVGRWRTLPPCQWCG